MKIALLFWILSFLISGNLEQEQKLYIRINAVGDIMPATSYPVLIEPPEKEKTYLNFLKDWLKIGNPDFVFGNLEGALTFYNETYKDLTKPYTFAFQIPPRYAKVLKLLGFNIMSVANNHALDFDLKGYEDTKKFLYNEGITPLGDKNKAKFFCIKGVKVAWLAFTWHDFFNNILKVKSRRKYEINQKNFGNKRYFDNISSWRK